MTTHQEDLVSWHAFPEVPQWRSFVPQLVFRLAWERPSMSSDDVIRVFETDSLVEALGILDEPIGCRVHYLAVPRDAQRGRRVAYELSIGISDPYKAKPRRLRDPSDSVLWCQAHQGHAYFALIKRAPRGEIELVVGGDTPEDCHEIWATVCAWIRTLYRIRFPRTQSLKHMDYPLKTRAEMRRSKQAFNRRICEILESAEKAERKLRPFQITGRGHEPRISLDRELATALRGANLHRYTTSGYGSKSYYPLRVFERAAQVLHAEFGRPVVDVGMDSERRGSASFALASKVSD